MNCSIMHQYTPFVQHLDTLFFAASKSPVEHKGEIERATNGLAKRQLNQLVSRDSRREGGVFFTDCDVASVAAKFLKPLIRRGAMVCDPCCGAGDLLLACSNFMQTKSGLRSTLLAWEKQLSGLDIHSSFSEATRLRLALRCIERTGGSLRKPIRPKHLFPQVKTQSCFAAPELIQQSDAVIINPPFFKTAAPANCRWASGSVNSAAIVLAHVVSEMAMGARLVAILPDVLRSGTRYESWRDLICNSISIQQVKLLNQFDPQTDIHVFLLVGRKTASNSKLKKSITKFAGKTHKGRTVDELFSVSVGKIVDYREPHKGQWQPYVKAKGLPSWSKVRDCFPSRRCAKAGVKPPFVVVKRTSRPEDPQRAVATIICGKRPVAVENHLLVFEPRDGKLRSCVRLLEVLKAPTTSNYLNQQIRCRHLTVSSVKAIPWVVPNSETTSNGPISVRN